MSWTDQFAKSFNRALKDESVEGGIYPAADHIGIAGEISPALIDPLADALAGNAMASLEPGLSACGSPIEEAMLGALCIAGLHKVDAVQIETEASARLGRSGEVLDLLIIEPQFSVGRYRADFRLVQRNRWGAGEDKVAQAELLIECDGHDFHERSKEQARRDKRRDRELQSDGFKVLHFTGSEIWADPLACAQEALRQIGTDSIDAAQAKFEESSTE